MGGDLQISASRSDMFAAAPGEHALDRTLDIGSLRVDNRVLLSPLAGVSDVPFRRICRELGAGLTYIEMLSAVAIGRKAPRTDRMLARHPSERTLGVQVTGDDPGILADAVRGLADHGFETIDLNMGCPVRKIVRKGWGSALLRDPAHIGRLVESCRAATSRPLSAKIRLGYTLASANVEEVSRRIAGGGADMLIIHGRTRTDDYGVPVRYEAIARGIEAARRERPDIVVLGNGNVMCPASAACMVERTGCDGVLVSRGALGNPWVFDQIARRRAAHPTIEEWYAVLRRHIQYHREHFGDDLLAVVCMRKHLLWYVAGFRRTRPLRVRLGAVDTFEEAIALLDGFVAQQPPGTVRYATGHHGVDLPERDTYDPKFDMDREHDRGVVEGR